MKQMFPFLCYMNQNCEIMYQHKYFNQQADGSETSESVDHGNSVRKHAWLMLFKTMRRLTNINFSGKYQ